MIRVEDLVVGYGGSIVIDGASFVLEGPGLVQVLGPNGAGKTTLLKTILGLIKPRRGRVYIDGVDVTGRPRAAGRYIGYVPQLTYAETHRYPVTVWELVESALLLRRKRWPRLGVGKKLREKVAEALEKTRVPQSLWNRNFWRLSGGEKQRVLIARSLVHNPVILLMDEPLSAVDPAGKKELARLIAELSKKKLVVVTSHDPVLLLEYTDKVILMNKGIMITGAPEEVLTLKNTRLVYGEAVVEVTGHIHICDEHRPR